MFQFHWLHGMLFIEYSQVAALWRESPLNPKRGQAPAEPKAKKVKSDKENPKKPRSKKTKTDSKADESDE